MRSTAGCRTTVVRHSCCPAPVGRLSRRKRPWAAASFPEQPGSPKAATEQAWSGAEQPRSSQIARGCGRLAIAQLAPLLFLLLLLVSTAQGSSAVGALDGLGLPTSSLAGAFALRRLLANYTGPTLRVRKPAEATGGTVSLTANGYRIHTFTAVGGAAFSTPRALQADILIVAGGGGGGAGRDIGCEAGGGGARGLIHLRPGLKLTGKRTPP